MRWKSTTSVLLKSAAPGYFEWILNQALQHQVPPGWLIDKQGLLMLWSAKDGEGGGGVSGGTEPGTPAPAVRGE